MVMVPLQVSLIAILTFQYANTEAPPGYVKPIEADDKNPPKYEYGYNIEDEKGASQGKLETRDGIYALGRYYVQNPDSTHSVQYYADDWGYHPFIEYGSVGPHSRSRTQLLLGVEAVKALATNKFTPQSVHPKQHVTDAINSKLAGESKQTEHQPQPILIQQPQQILVPQPQLYLQQQQQPQIHFLLQQPQIQPTQQHLPQQDQNVVVQQIQQPLIIPQQGHSQLEIQQQNEVVQHQPEIVSDQSDSVVTEARGRQNQQHQQVLVHHQISHEIQQGHNEENLAPQALPLQGTLAPQALPLQGTLAPQALPLQGTLAPQALPLQGTLAPQALPLQGNLAHDKQVQENILVNEQQSSGVFGSRINHIERKKPSYNVEIQHSADKLIENTKNLVSGQDVLNINEAAVESFTAKAVTELNKIEVSSVSSLINEPIVVADLDEKIAITTENSLRDNEQIYSTTANTVETVSTKSFGVTEPATVLVTPRPIQADFLSGVQLENVGDSKIQINNAEHHGQVETSTQRQNYIVEVQKSLPLYLGKLEYDQHSVLALKAQQGLSNQDLQQKAIENIELGKTLFSFPVQNNLQIHQQLPEVSIRDNFIEVDQQQAQHNTAFEHVTPAALIIEKQVPIVHTKIVEKPIEVTKVIKEPYPVQVPVHIPVQVPVEVEKRIPVTVEKIIEKPVKVTEILEKQVPIPQPYPVEKIVEKPVPVEVTKYIDRPYPVRVPVAQPVPYPVERVVEKIVKQPYPVPIKVPVEVKVPITVEKIVEKKVPVPQYIDRPIQVEKIVEKPVPHYIDRPYPIHVQVPFPVAEVYALPFANKQAHGVQELVQSSQKYPVAVKTVNDYQRGPIFQKEYNQVNFRQNVAASNQHISSAQVILKENNGYLPPVHNCDQLNSYSSQNPYYTIRPDDYIGLSPPKISGNQQNLPRKFRNARSNFNNNLRVEYGFMPPLRPSQEIDADGHPIEREKP